MYIHMLIKIGCTVIIKAPQQQAFWIYILYIISYISYFRNLITTVEANQR